MTDTLQSMPMRFRLGSCTCDGILLHFVHGRRTRRNETALVMVMAWIQTRPKPAVLRVTTKAVKPMIPGLQLKQ